MFRRHRISSATFYKWKSKYGGLEVPEARRLKALENKNRRLMKLLAASLLDNAAWQLLNPILRKPSSNRPLRKNVRFRTRKLLGPNGPTRAMLSQMC